MYASPYFAPAAAAYCSGQLLTKLASVFGHVVASAALGYAFFPRQVRPATLLLTGFCAFAPDLDVLGFQWGVRYESQWGHRGFTHSLLFGVVFGVLMALIFNTFRKKSTATATGPLVPANWQLPLWCVLSTVSHPLLDCLTNGGRGCALWWPLSLERVFFPVRPILVSPLGAGAFFSEWGLKVLLSELWWIGVPSLVLVVAARAVPYFRNQQL